MSAAPRRLLLVGAGGLARETAVAARAAGDEVVGYLDDDPGRAGTELEGAPVLGGLEVLDREAAAQLVLCPGRGTAREQLTRRLAALGVPAQRYATVAHPSAVVAEGCQIGGGSILLAGVVLTAAVRLGSHVVVMPQVTLTHDVAVADFATLCAGVQLGGSVSVGRAAYVGMSASIRERVSVGEEAVVGMGSVLLSDVPAREVWAGVPARRLLQRAS